MTTTLERIATPYIINTPKNMYNAFNDMMRRARISEKDLLDYGCNYFGIEGGRGKRVVFGKTLSEVMANCEAQGIHLPLITGPLPSYEEYKKLKSEVQR